ncbi:MAG: tetraacyldisaccharide 4'-kinase, partial [Bacteroidota bacterium]
KDDRGGLQYGDEAFQVAHKFPKVPVAVCENRVTGVEQLLKTTKTDIVVLDDAFQHRRIHRDLDIVMVDGSRLPADDLLLPAGRLREPVRNLARAQAVIVTKVPDAEAATRAVRTLNGSRRGFRTAVFGLRPKAVQSVAEDLAHPPSFLQNHPVHLFSGLGNNTAFAHTTRQLGATVLSHTTFPDHHAYKPADIQKILAEYAPETENKGKLAPPLLLTTEKDFFRLKALGLLDHFSEVPLHYLQVKMVPEMGWEAIAAQINALIESNDNPN